MLLEFVVVIVLLTSMETVQSKVLVAVADPFDGVRQMEFLGDWAAAPSALGLPFGARRRAMPAVHASVQPPRWRRCSRVAQTYTVLPATQN